MSIIVCVRLCWCGWRVLGGASVPELDSMWHKLADSPQVLQQMFSMPYTAAVLEGLEANPSLAQQVDATENCCLVTDKPSFSCKTIT